MLLTLPALYLTYHSQYTHGDCMWQIEITKISIAVWCRSFQNVHDRARGFGGIMQY